MPARGHLSVARSGMIVALASALTACPIPLPSGYEADSRENLPAAPLDWITVGATTREQVLLELGEADGEGRDGSWLAYGSAYSKGGVAFVVLAGGSGAGGGGEKIEYRRLVVSFDEGGRVASVDLVTRECWESIVAMGSSGTRTPPCLRTDSPD